MKFYKSNIKNHKTTYLTKITHFIVFFPILIGTFLRFFKLDWGNGHHFHPDEYHLVISANQIDFPEQMHPHLFSYGSTTVYLIYFSKVILNILFNYDPSLFIVGRFFSATFSTLSLFVIYLIAKHIFNKPTPVFLITAVSALTPGIIQQAHFATPESAISFWMLLGLYFSIKYLNKPNLKNVALSGISTSLAMATKITSILTLPGPLISFCYKHIREKKFKKILLSSFIFVFVTVIFYFVAFPYSILDLQGLKHSMNYETAVGKGTQKVFYTRSFENTLPIIFQFTKILIYAIDPVNLILGTIGLVLIIYLFTKNYRKEIGAVYFLIIYFFLSYFLFNSFLYAKWTRFIAPTFPYFAIFSALLISKVNKINKKAGIFLAGLSMTSVIIWGISFFAIYIKPDVRVQATAWAQNNIPANSYILTETGNILEAPLKGNYTKIPFDFYHLDEDPSLQDRLATELVKSDYFIIQSRRMFMDHSEKDFPLTYNFYNKLVNCNLGFEKIKTFTSFPTVPLINISLNDETAEETWSVFDHPVIRIYKKTVNYDEETYKRILNI
ncbi:glycosyltransferase family 39 protein [Candidatus Woesebacteria bacterium]|nr:glycosyltransferase family 39 protein [Candidatus Woesebacteria bacterium]